MNIISNLLLRLSSKSRNVPINLIFKILFLPSCPFQSITQLVSSRLLGNLGFCFVSFWMILQKKFKDTQFYHAVVKEFTPDMYSAIRDSVIFFTVQHCSTAVLIFRGFRSCCSFLSQPFFVIFVSHKNGSIGRV